METGPTCKKNERKMANVLGDLVDSYTLRYKLEKHPDYSVYVAFFNDVCNCSELKALVMDGKLNAALIDNRLVSNLSIEFIFFLY